MLPTLDGSKRRLGQVAGRSGAAAAATPTIARAAGVDWGDRVTNPIRLTSKRIGPPPSLTRVGKCLRFNRAEAGNMDAWLDAARGGPLGA